MPRSFVHCVHDAEGDDVAPGDGDGLRPADLIRPHARFAREGGWDYRRFEAAHDPQVSDPEGLVSILEEIAALA